MEIRIENLSKRFGKKYALDHISLTIENGMFGLLGSNGAGKTTLMRILATLSLKTEGQIMVNNISIEHAKEIRKIIGYLPQEFSVYSCMTIWQAMDYLGVLSELSKKERMERIPKLLNQVNLWEERNKKIKALSGGMKRRLGIAQAIMHNPRILIVDEPTAGLDPEERIRFRNLLGEIALDRIVLLSTHIVGDIEASCEYIAVLDKGKIIFHNTVHELSKQAEGKVYSLSVPTKEMEDIRRRFHILSMQSYAHNTVFRVLSDSIPDSTAVLCDPNIEDGYMEILRKQEGRCRNGFIR